MNFAAPVPRWCCLTSCWVSVFLIFPQRVLYVIGSYILCVCIHSSSFFCPLHVLLRISVVHFKFSFASRFHNLSRIRCSTPVSLNSCLSQHMEIPSELWDSCQHFQYHLAASIKQRWIQTSASTGSTSPSFCRICSCSVQWRSPWAIRVDETKLWSRHKVCVSNKVRFAFLVFPLMLLFILDH